MNRNIKNSKIILPELITVQRVSYVEPPLLLTPLQGCGLNTSQLDNVLNSGQSSIDDSSSNRNDYTPAQNKLQPFADDKERPVDTMIKRKERESIHESNMSHTFIK